MLIEMERISENKLPRASSCLVLFLLAYSPTFFCLLPFSLSHILSPYLFPPFSLFSSLLLYLLLYLSLSLPSSLPYPISLPSSLPIFFLPPSLPLFSLLPPLFLNLSFFLLFLSVKDHGAYQIGRASCRERVLYTV